MNPIIGMRSRH